MRPRVVVCSLGGNEDPWMLPASEPSDRTWIHGGERTLYESSVAAAAAGFDVELRGEIHLESLRTMTEAWGVKVAAGDLAPRRPDADDIVVVPEGWDEPMQFIRIAFSPARAMLLICGPPGLVGWDFSPEWAPPELATVSPDEVARPETFAAMRSLGFELLTNARALAEVAVTSGTECTFLGSGRPVPWPEPVAERDHDVAVIVSNRWSESASATASAVPGASVLWIPELPNDALLREISRARVLVWTGRIEGVARTLNECRAMGTVPVALRTPVMRDLDEERGAVLVDSLDAMPSAIEDLLSDENRLADLSERGKRAARQLTAWEPFADRVALALQAPSVDPGRSARAATGLALDAALGGATVDQLAGGAALRRAYEALRRRNITGRSAMADRVRETRLELERALRELSEHEGSLSRELRERDRQLANLKATKTFRYTAALRAPYEWIRSRLQMNDP